MTTPNTAAPQARRGGTDESPTRQVARGALEEDTNMNEPTAIEVVDDAQGPGNLPVAAGDSGMLAMGRTPTEAIANAQEIARVLMDVIRKQGMTTIIPSKKGAREHVNVEAWTTLGALTGHTVLIESTSICVDDEGNTGYEAKAVLVNGSGQTVGTGEAMCTRGERDWKHRAAYALRSMAQTRAVSKAYRSRLDFIVKLAGFQTTPDEEIPRDLIDEGQWREWTKEAMTPLVERFGRDVAQAAWKAEGSPYMKPADTDIIAAIEQRAQELSKVDPVTGEVIDATDDQQEPQEAQEAPEGGDGGDDNDAAAEAAVGGDSDAGTGPGGYPPMQGGWTAGPDAWVRWCWLREQHSIDPSAPNANEEAKLIAAVQDLGAAPNVETFGKDAVWKRVLKACGLTVEWETRQQQLDVEPADAPATGDGTS